MPASKAQRAATAQRRTEAIKLRLAGIDYDTIAERLGYASRGAACTDINRALEAAAAQQAASAEALRHEELSRLDRLQAGLWTTAAGGDTKAVDSVLRIIDRRIRLLGLDKPQQVEIVTVGAVDAEIRRLTAELGLNDPTPAELVDD